MSLHLAGEVGERAAERLEEAEELRCGRLGPAHLMERLGNRCRD
jgi:hypothetical protein